MTAVLALGDKGSTLAGLSLPILGVLVSVFLLAVLGLSFWRRWDQAKRDKRKSDKEVGR